MQPGRGLAVEHVAVVMTITGACGRASCSNAGSPLISSRPAGVDLFAFQQVIVHG